jgi:hypothetical protein
VLRARLRRGRNHFGDGFTEAGHANRLARLADLLQEAQALGLELGNGDFLHGLDHTMVNYHGQTKEQQADIPEMQKLDLDITFLWLHQTA